MLLIHVADVITPTIPLTGAWVFDSGGGNAGDALVTLNSALSALAVVVAFVCGVFVVVYVFSRSVMW